jgi:hypothetical protein
MQPVVSFVVVVGRDETVEASDERVDLDAGVAARRATSAALKPPWLSRRSNVERAMSTGSAAGTKRRLPGI